MRGFRVSAHAMTSPCVYFAQKRRIFSLFFFFLVFGVHCFAEECYWSAAGQTAQPVVPYQGTPCLDPAAGHGGPVGPGQTLFPKMKKIQEEDLRRKRFKKKTVQEDLNGRFKRKI